MEPEPWDPPRPLDPLVVRTELVGMREEAGDLDGDAGRQADAFRRTVVFNVDHARLAVRYVIGCQAGQEISLGQCPPAEVGNLFGAEATPAQALDSAVAAD